MERRSDWRTALEQLINDSGLVASYAIAFVVLGAEILDSQGWKLLLRSAGLAMLLAGLVFYFWRIRRSVHLLHSEKPVPLVLVAGVPRRAAEADLALLKDTITHHTGFKDFHTVEQFFNVRYDDLLAHRHDPLPTDPAVWHDFLDQAQQEARQFLEHVAGRRVYHVAVRGPSALAMGLGAVIGTRSRVVGYHYSDNHYHPVLDLTDDVRQVKESSADRPFLFVSMIYPEAFAEDTAVVLDLAGHIPTGDVQAYLATWPQPPPLVEVRNTYRGNLPVGDWVPVVQELFSVFNVLQRDRAVRRIHLFQAMPGPLALGLGMALGPFVPITVYQYDRTQGTYFPALHLNQLRSLLW